MKPVSAFQAEDGSIHLTRKDAAIATFRHRHAGVFGEDAMAMMLQRPRELGELLTAIGAPDEPVAPRPRKNIPIAQAVGPAPGTKRRKRTAA
jgi:hypothetical protein